MKQVKVVLGRFQPMTLGHLKIATYKDLKGPDSEQKSNLREHPDLKEIAKQKTVIFVVSTPPEKVDKRHPFDDNLMKKEFDIIKKNYSSEIEDIMYVKGADICAWGEMLKHAGYQASVWITGSDEFKMYKGMALKVPQYEEGNRDNRDFKDACTKSFYVEEVQRNESSTDFISTISGTKVRQSLLDNDKELFKRMMPKGTDKLFDDFKKAVENAPEPVKKTKKTKKIKEYFYNSKISLKNYIQEHLINEGGNAVESQRIPAIIAPKIYEEIEQTVRSVSKFKSLKMAPLGSIGKKNDDDTTGDIDIAIEVKTKDELNEIIDTCFSDCEINLHTMSTISSFGYKYDIDGYKGIAQIDFMIVKNIDWAKFRYHSPNFRLKESKYKGGARNIMLVDVISLIPVKDVQDEYFEDGVTVKRHWKYTFNTEGIFLQLVDYCGKNGKPIKNGKKLKEFEQLITNDPQNFVRFVFGDEGTLADVNSAESVWAALHDPKKFKWGKDVVEKIEEKVYNDKSMQEFNFDPKDFPCQYYNVKQ